MVLQQFDEYKKYTHKVNARQRNEQTKKNVDKLHDMNYNFLPHLFSNFF